MIVTIDGPAGTGKSTLARRVAAALGFAFFDTGAMYRAFAWQCAQMGVNEHHVQSAIEQFQFRIEGDGDRRYFVGDVDVTQEIRQPKITILASRFAIFPEVRQAMVKIQRQFGKEQDAVFEGRDMGSVVFPNADVKIFLTARPDVRAKRRYRDLKGDYPLEKVKMEMEERDRQDRTRKVSPLKKAKDAFEVDTSDLTIDEAVAKVLAIVRRPKPMKLLYRCILGLARCYFKCFFGLNVYGQEHFLPGKAILAPNHASFFDPPVVSAACPEEVHFLGKASLFKVPLFGALIRALNTHPVTRGASDAATFRLLVQILQEGNKLILFPEGNRTPNGKLQPIEKGLAFLVAKTHAAILPIYVHGTWEAWNRFRKLPRWRGKIACVFGTPIVWRTFASLGKKEAQEAIAKRYEQALRDLKQWYEDGALGTPP